MKIKLLTSAFCLGLTFSCASKQDRQTVVVDDNQRHTTTERNTLDSNNKNIEQGVVPNTNQDVTGSSETNPIDLPTLTPGTDTDSSTGVSVDPLSSLQEYVSDQEMFYISTAIQEINEGVEEVALDARLSLSTISEIELKLLTRLEEIVAEAVEIASSGDADLIDQDDVDAAIRSYDDYADILLEEATR